jgi:hypothetical protein
VLQSWGAAVTQRLQCRHAAAMGLVQPVLREPSANPTSHIPHICLLQGQEEHALAWPSVCLSVAACGLEGGEYLSLGCSEGSIHVFKWDQWEDYHARHIVAPGDYSCCLHIHPT